jgi:hypothetical protein
MLAVGAATSFAAGIIGPLIAAVLSVVMMLNDLSRAHDISKQQHIIISIAKSANYAVITVLIFLLCQKQVGLSSTKLQLIPAISGLLLFALNWLNYASQPMAKRKLAP